MSWDTIWESVFSSREWGKYPPEELIRFIARTFYRVPDRSAVRVLEVGCGPGANIWYLSREGFTVSGIDGSPSAIDTARRRLASEKLEADLRVGDIVALRDVYEPESFDAVIDVACLQCNRLSTVTAVVGQIHGILKQGGHMFSMMVAAGSVGQGSGTELESGTYTGIVDGPLSGAGVNHFFTLDEVQAVFGDFRDVSVEYAIRSYDQRKSPYKHWVTTARKHE
jgi:SAM-dependent methyltransferase